MLLPGVLCNHRCPDELRLGELTSNSWHFGIKIGIAALINAIAVFCLIMKLASKFWLYRLEKKQADYLQSLDEELEVTDSATLPVMTTNQGRIWGGGGALGAQASPLSQDSI